MPKRAAKLPPSKTGNRPFLVDRNAPASKQKPTGLKVMPIPFAPPSIDAMDAQASSRQAGKASKPYKPAPVFDFQGATERIFALPQPQPVTPLQVEDAKRAGEIAELRALIANLPRPDPQDYVSTPYQAPPMPVREQVAFPERATPRDEPVSGIMAALAGFIDPSGAGRYAAAPLQAALAQANTETEDRMARFRYAVQQADTNYDDAFAAREGQVRLDVMNRDHAQRQQDALRAAILAYSGQQAELGAQAQGMEATGRATAPLLIQQQQAGIDQQAIDAASALMNAAIAANKQERENVESENDYALKDYQHQINAEKAQQLDAYRQKRLDDYDLDRDVRRDIGMKPVPIHQIINSLVRAAGAGIDASGPLGYNLPGADKAIQDAEARRVERQTKLQAALKANDPKIKIANDFAKIAAQEADRLSKMYQKAATDARKADPNAPLTHLNGLLEAVQRADWHKGEQKRKLDALVDNWTPTPHAPIGSVKPVSSLSTQELFRELTAP